MNDLEQQLQDEMGAATAWTVPPVDVAGIAAVGRRERRRRGGLAAVAGAAAAALVTVGVLAVLPGGGRSAVGPADRPTGREQTRVDRVADLPLGPASDAPWSDGDVVHASGTTYESESLSEVRFAAGTTIVVDRRGQGWVLLMIRDGEVTEIAYAAGEVPRVTGRLSADGELVAVTEREGARNTVTLRDTGTGQAVASTTTTNDGGFDAGLDFANVTDEGRVVWTGTDTGFTVWTPGSDPVPVTGVDGFATGGAGYPAGLALDTETQGAVYGTVDGDGRFTRTGSMEQESGVVWSPSGGYWAYPTQSAQPTVRVGQAKGGPIKLTFAGNNDTADVVGWESDTSVVIDVKPSNDPHVRVRCDVERRSCERVPTES